MVREKRKNANVVSLEIAKVVSKVGCCAIAGACNYWKVRFDRSNGDNGNRGAKTVVMDSI